jgi:hypothetical protein
MLSEIGTHYAGRQILGAGGEATIRPVNVSLVFDA